MDKMSHMRFFSWVASFLIVGSAFAATSGSYEKAAKSISVGKTATVSLTAEYDPDEGTYDEKSPVAYYYVKLNRGNSYTIWLDGASAGTNSTIEIFDIYAKEGDDEPFGASFSGYDYVEDGVACSRQILFAEDWDLEEDPKSWTYYICVIADQMSEKATLHVSQGEILPTGLDENPTVLTPEATRKTLANAKFLNDGEHYVSVRMEAGRRYAFGVRKSGVKDPFDFVIEGTGTEKAYAAWANDCDKAVTFVPDETDDYLIEITRTDSVTSGSFSFDYMCFAAREISKHKSQPLAVGGTLSCQPGHLNNPTSGAYDGIADDCLYKFTAVKGQSYVVSTEGAKTNLLLRVFDSTGKTLGENVGLGDGKRDVRLGFTAAAAGAYYVGLSEVIDDEAEKPSGQKVLLRLETVGTPEHGPIALTAVPAAATDNPVKVDAAGSAAFAFDKQNWTQTFEVGGRADITYCFQCAFVDPKTASNLRLKAEAYTVNGTRETVIASSGAISPQATTYLSVKRTTSGAFRLRVSVEDGLGLDYPAVKVHTMAYYSGRDPKVKGLGTLVVEAKGADSTWYLGTQKTVKYAFGSSILVPAGATQKVTFDAVKGFSVVPAFKEVVCGLGETKVTATYNDTFDPKDNEMKGATTWSLKATATDMSRTLMDNDTCDWFKFTAQDGYYYDFSFTKNDADEARLTLCDATGKPLAGASGVASLSKYGLKKGTYYAKVAHKAAPAKDGAYTLSGQWTKVGAVKLDKAAYSVKENAASVTLKLKKTANGGKVSVRLRTENGAYACAAGTAPADHPEYAKFHAVDQVYTWENGDNKDKVVTIKLIPDIVGYYHANARSFTVVLEDAGGDYKAVIAVPRVQVTLTESQSSKVKDTIASAYKPIATKTVSKDEAALVRSGTFFGVLQAKAGALRDGFPEFASVTLTSAAKVTTSQGVTATNDTLSAKVALAGKTYTFKSDAKNPVVWEEPQAGEKRTTLRMVQTVNKVVYTNELTLALNDYGQSTDKDGTGVSSWIRQSAQAKLVMNVPNADNKGVQADIRYDGELFRDNSKIQEYLNAVANFAGYYTMALVPTAREGLSSVAEVKPGNAYLTVTVDNGGKAKIAGKLADGTAVSLSSIAASVRQSKTSSVGYDLLVPVFIAKKPSCVGGVLRLTATEAYNGDGRKTVVVESDSSRAFWNSDNLALSERNDRRIACAFEVTGGFYDTVERLQRHYFDRDFDSFAIDTVSASEMPASLFAIGGISYAPVTVKEADGFKVDLAVDAFATDKKTLVKDATKKYVDFEKSANPANVQVKIARATGLVTGGFSVWGEGKDAAGNRVQKEITGAKHYGVLLMNRDGTETGLDACAITAGFFSQAVSVPSGASTRRWTYSGPFNIVADEE